MTETSPTPAETNIFLGYIDEAEYCRQRGISLRTAQRDRQLRQCPPYTVIGQRVVYHIEAIRTWLLERERPVERKASARRPRRGLGAHRLASSTAIPSPRSPPPAAITWRRR